MRNKVMISEEGAGYLRKGQMWMYRNNLVSDIDCFANGSAVDIYCDEEYLGTGFLSKDSHITVRILTKKQDTEIDHDFFRMRIQKAYDFRKTVETQIDNCRLVFGEADGLPGLTVDRYNDILSVQVSIQGMECRKQELYQILLEVLEEDDQVINGIYERNDFNVRSKEGLEMYKGWYQKTDALSAKTVITENGLRINVDIENGQKTGYFLDQKSNRALLQRMSHGKRVLDCFTHTGGFALNAAKGNAEHVDAVDVSDTALKQAYENAKLNHLEDRMSFIQADVFRYLETCKKGQYDLIVLDPPAFTKSRRTISHAYNGYEEINLKAMKLLEDGGYLITCSCSRFMEIQMFEQMLKEAASEARVTLKQVSVTQQNADHPILWAMEETSYLKFYIFQVNSID